VTTNGKPDAGVVLDPGKPAAPDESTMTLMAAIPLLLRSDARSIAIIGFGSGMTAEVALSLTGVQRLDTIEIEPAMVEAGRGFFPRVRRPFEDPRSRIHIEDAKSYFARQQSRYDLILSEPSNPWVNGVASLFTTEFYRDVKRHLKEGGLFAQWIQLYSRSWTTGWSPRSSGRSARTSRTTPSTRLRETPMSSWWRRRPDGSPGHARRAGLGPA